MKPAALKVYLLLLAALACAWLAMHLGPLAARGSAGMPLLLGAIGLYLCSHLARMLRLALLTLDRREKAGALVAAHTLTAFPSSFLPFKVGELLRLAAFVHVFDGRSKALAVWLAERFGDVVVLSAFILALYLFNVDLPSSLRLVLLVFLLATMLGLLSLFAVAKTLVYLNRHLVLNSHSARGLLLLRASHALRLLELDIYRSLEGRLSGFALLSLLVWTLEIAALALFTPLVNDLASAGGPAFGALLSAALLANLPGGAGASGFGLYQSLVLVGLSFICMGTLYFASRKRPSRP